MGAAIAELIALLVMWLFVGALIGGAVLRSGISFYNSLVGGPNGSIAVRQQRFARATAIALVIALANALTHAALQVVFVLAGELDVSGPRMLATVVLLPVGLFISAKLLAMLLPTTFPRAVLVTICCFLIGVVLLSVALMCFLLVVAVRSAIDSYR